MKRTMAVIALIGMIPLAGWLVGFFVQSKLDGQWAEVVHRELGEKGVTAVKSGQLSLKRYCSTADGLQESACDTYNHVLALQQTSVIAALVGVALLLVIFAAARLASSNRNLLVALFAPGLKLVLFVLFALIIVQGAIGTYSAYILEATLIHRVHFVIIGAIGFGALVGAFNMIRAGLSISRRARLGVIGQAVSRDEQPKLWEFVTNLAQVLGAQPPHQIVVGLDPSFYVTSADVTVMPAGVTHHDETLYLSLPLMRILSRDELAAVVGHELGHFRGEDTKFSLRFYPIYAGTTQALVALQTEGEGASTVALLPARAMLAFFVEEFAKAERTIGRERELEADKAGASVASPHAIATSLLKLGAFAPLWSRVQTEVVEALNQGKAHTNISEFFAATAASSAKLELIDEVANQATSHPTDTHPPTIQRVTALGLSLQDIRTSALQIDPCSSSAQLLENVTKLEENLTEVIHRIIVEHGIVQRQDEDGQTDDGESSGRENVGLCPNCEEKIPIDSLACPNCKASFGQGSEWKIGKLPNN